MCGRLHLKCEDEWTPSFQPGRLAHTLQEHFHVSQSITSRPLFALMRRDPFARMGSLEICAPRLHSLQLSLSPPLYSPRRSPSLTFHSLSIFLIDSAPSQGLSVFVSPRQVVFSKLSLRVFADCLVYRCSLPLSPLIHSPFPPSLLAHSSPTESGM